MTLGKLFIVATPIGNLGDFTSRALDTLKSVDVILCEDTRVTQKLLEHYSISKQTLSYHHHSDERKVKEIQNLLQDGKDVALVTDAGTPGISDPGNMLVSMLSKRILELQIIPVPGPSALVAALSISGFPTDKFVFLGFPPHKNKRQKYFKEIAEQTITTIFFESGHRIEKCLEELSTVLNPEREVVVCRELTKKFETIYRGGAHKMKEIMKDTRGEFVVIVNGS